MSRNSEHIEKRTRTVSRTIEVEIVEHLCIGCGKWFEAHRTDAKFCTKGCKATHWSRIYRGSKEQRLLKLYAACAAFMDHPTSGEST